MTSLRILPSGTPLPLFGTQTTRMIENLALQQVGHGELIARAGRACARWVRALRPDAKTIWLACGPGLNGADGYACAAELQIALAAWGGQIRCTPPQETATPTHLLRQRFINAAQEAGVEWSHQPSDNTDLVVDALFGLGQTTSRGLASPWHSYWQFLNQAQDCFAIDLPTGLHADTGTMGLDMNWNPHQHRHTLSLLTLKPGLWTHQGRDAAGDIWFDSLNIEPQPLQPDAWLFRGMASDSVNLRAFPHESHKGSRGTVWVIGGSAGMTGAAILASEAALRSGAGKVRLFSLQPLAAEPISAARPFLMVQGLAQGLSAHETFPNDLPQTLLCGCGAGQQISEWLTKLLLLKTTLILDADALNAVAKEPALMALLQNRHDSYHTVLTPHPAEAARLLNTSVNAVQQHRMQSALRMAEMTGAFVVLKGSGTVVASPHEKHPLYINPTGDSTLAVAGSGDILAGWLAGLLAQQPRCNKAQLHALICQAVWEHGKGSAGTPLG